MYTFIIYLFSSSILFGQTLYNKNWISGQANKPNDERMIIHLGRDKESISPIILEGWPYVHSFNISLNDKVGDFKAYSNGCYFFTADGRKAKNADTFNLSNRWLNWCMNDIDQYYRGVNGSMFLPHAKDENQYTIIHMNNGDHEGFLPYQICTSQIHLVPGKDSIFFSDINVPIHFDSTYDYYTLSAVKHANGEDYWVSVLEFYFPKLVSLLIHNGNVIDSNVLMLDHPCKDFNSGPICNSNSVYSRDGKKFAYACCIGGVHVLDFDRVTGKYSNHIHYDFPKMQPDLVAWEGDLEFSPSGKYLYVSHCTYLWQYDLHADTPFGFDTFTIMQSSDPGTQPVTLMQYGPDSILYLAPCGFGVNCIGAIYEPDKHGLDCDYRPCQIPTPHKIDIGIPNFPNYDLGKIGGNHPTLFPLRIQTSNGTNYKILFDSPPQNHWQYLIFDALGRVVLNGALSDYISGLKPIYLQIPSSFSQGVYFFTVFNDLGVIQGSSQMLLF